MSAKRISKAGMGIAIAVVTLLYPVFSQQASIIDTYTVINLGRLLGDDNVARGLSFSGQVAGRSGNLQGSGARAFVWTLGVAQDLGTLPGGDYSEASAVNIAGQVVGSSNTGTAIRGFLWTGQAGMQDLGTLPGHSSSRAYFINDGGQVVGYSSGSGGFRAFLWTASGGMQDLGSLAGYPFAVAVDINPRGDVVGSVSRPNGIHRAVLWSPTVRDLGVLPAPHHLSSKAYAVNDAGEVVGHSSGRTGRRAFIWTQAEGMRDLGALPGGSDARALHINEAGQVVGSAQTNQGARAFIWTRSDGMRDLNDLITVPIVTLLEALSINERGQILVRGLHGSPNALHDHQDHRHDGPTRVFLLTPR